MAVFSQIKNFIKSGKSEQSLSRSSTQKYEQAARMVEEENLAKQTMPSYPGLENYQLKNKLGDGAFSKVYKALKLDTNEKVAIKIVSKHELSNQQKASVLKEAQIMKTLDHPSIIDMYDFIETKEYYFLVLELCEGGEIFHQIVRLTYFSEDLSRHCIRQVAEGIRYLHEEKGIVHRDIKPENLLFVPIPFKERSTPLPPSEFDEPKEDEGEFTPGVGGGGIGAVKIADFGLSKVVWDQQTMTPCGTVGYTAPEIVKDQRYSKSVDMWALGCVLYTLLWQYTFLSPWWDTISEEAKDLVENLLHVDPEKRFTILEFLDHPWMKQEKPPIDLTTVPMFTATETNTETEAEAFKRMIQERNRDQEELEAAVPPCHYARRDLFSGVSSMKEMFDISYAVHRMTEEKQRRKQLKQQPEPNHRSLFMSAVNDMDDDVDDHITEDDSTTASSTQEDEELEALRNKLEVVQVEGDQTPKPRNKSNKDGGLFELNMNNATLLGRRKIPSATQPIDEP
ncbi:kinase-like domain-containing protein [Gilbertella persicaria]|uniref:kinase-like domain-containing protein n=1 Tax=Gilbertella persicaria TaxID=101096 RepID=UPI00221E40E8|nr:kinase-like domain-containing protein [Gilbertella persicaria]KAI8049787.1 kinase-like domain-containing protein [Gilbertella persicaria]